MTAFHATSRGFSSQVSDGVASNPGEPALPRFVASVDVPGRVLRGIGFWSGDFTEASGVKPFVGKLDVEQFSHLVCCAITGACIRHC